MANKLAGAFARVCARFVRNRKGATSIEYAMIAVGVAVAIVATVNGTGRSLNANFYGRVNSELSSAR